MSANANQNYATVTYKDTYDLSNGFDLSYSANGRTSFNNIYSGTYYIGVKIGNITLAMDQYVKPTILVDGTVKTKGNAIITYSTQADVEAYLSGITQRCKDLGIGWAWWHYHRNGYSESGDMALYRKNSYWGSQTWDQTALDALFSNYQD